MQKLMIVFFSLLFSGMATLAQQCPPPFNFTPSTGESKISIPPGIQDAKANSSYFFYQAATQFEMNVNHPWASFYSLQQEAKKVFQLAGTSIYLRPYAQQLTTAGLIYCLLRYHPSVLDAELPALIHILIENHYNDPYLEVQALERAKNYMSSTTYRNELEKIKLSFQHELGKEAEYKIFDKKLTHYYDSLSLQNNPLDTLALWESINWKILQLQMRYRLESVQKAKAFFQLPSN